MKKKSSMVGRSDPARRMLSVVIVRPTVGAKCRGFVKTDATGVAYVGWLAMKTLEHVDKIGHDTMYLGLAPHDGCVGVRSRKQKFPTNLFPMIYSM
jgi:hypothetical protein